MNLTAALETDGDILERYEYTAYGEIFNGKDKCCYTCRVRVAGWTGGNDGGRSRISVDAVKNRKTLK